MVEITAAAIIPFLSAFSFPEMMWVTGGLGVLITVLEGILHLNQYQQNWIAYRSTSESLKHEKYVYLGKASPYVNAADPPCSAGGKDRVAGFSGTCEMGVGGAAGG
jgi:hypothetical protein